MATDLLLERLVVVKLLAPDAERSRFEREAQAMAALAHPNIVQLFDYGEEEGRPYMVFEYLPGGSLEQRLDAPLRLPDEDTARIAAEIAAGLAHAHARGVVHRDMKPGNVLFDVEGRAKIADFGIARIGGVDTITKAGMVLGTAAYISPEQARGEPATPASDVYSFGVLLYRILSGRPVRGAESRRARCDASRRGGAVACVDSSGGACVAGKTGYVGPRQAPRGSPSRRCRASRGARP